MLVMHELVVSEIDQMRQRTSREIYFFFNDILFSVKKIQIKGSLKHHERCKPYKLPNW